MQPTIQQLQRLASYGSAGSPLIVAALAPAGSPLWSPAGDALTEGVPAASYASGIWNFRTSILIKGQRPSVYMDSASVGGITIPGFRLTFERGLDQEFNGPPDRYYARPQNVAIAVSAAPAIGDQLAWWVTVTGAFTIAWDSWRSDRVNAAIARALTASMTWSLDGRLPAGMQRTASNITLVSNALLTLFRDPAACRGARHTDGTLPWVAACTRFQNIGPLPPNWGRAVPNPVLQPPTPPAPTPQPTPPVAVQPQPGSSAGVSVPTIALGLAAGTLLAAGIAYAAAKNT